MKANKRYLALVATVAAVGLSGCGSLGAGSAPWDRTPIQITAVDSSGGQLNPELGIEQVDLPENARYSRLDVEAKLAPGVSVNDAIQYVADTEGLSINATRQADTQGQAAMISEVNALWAGVIPGIVETTVRAAVTAALGLGGPNPAPTASPPPGATTGDGSLVEQLRSWLALRGIQVGDGQLLDILTRPSP